MLSMHTINHFHDTSFLHRLPVYILNAVCFARRLDNKRDENTWIYVVTVKKALRFIGNVHDMLVG